MEKLGLSPKEKDAILYLLTAYVRNILKLTQAEHENDTKYKWFTSLTECPTRSKLHMFIQKTKSSTVF